MKKSDVLIRAGTLIAMTGSRTEASRRVSKDQAIGIVGGKVAWIEDFDEATEYVTGRFIDARDLVAFPGFVNAHGHLPMTLLRGLADDAPFQTWLHQVILPIEGKLVDPEMVRLGTELAVWECLRAGVTTVHDMYYFESDIAASCDALGIRAVLGQSVIDFPSPDNKGVRGRDIELCRDFIAEYRGHSRIVPHVAPHAPYSCSDETLKAAQLLAEREGVRLTIHVSESRFEVEESLRLYGMTPVGRLKHLGLLGPHAFFAHCVHLTDIDIDDLATTQTSVVHNPESNMKLGVGTAPILKLQKRGVVVGLGTDGAASNNDLGLLGEMDSAAKLQKLAQSDNSAFSAADALWIATRGSAAALGLSDRIGQIAPGFEADIVLMNFNQPETQPLYSEVSTLVYSANPRHVDTVIVAGQILVEKGELTSAPPLAHRAHVREFQARVAKVLEVTKF